MSRPDPYDIEDDLRDKIALTVLTTLLKNKDKLSISPKSLREQSELCYYIADTMLEARKT